MEGLGTGLLRNLKAGPGRSGMQAFKNYDEAGALRRIQCLKYLVLATMLMESDVDPFDAQASTHVPPTSLAAFHHCSICLRQFGVGIHCSAADKMSHLKRRKSTVSALYKVPRFLAFCDGRGR